MEFGTNNIKCKTFWDVERVIKNAGLKIKEPRNAAERRYYAQDVLLESKTLLSCPDYNARNSDCVGCRFFAHRHAREYESLTKI